MKDDDVYLEEGPAAGTTVVTMGVPEPDGTEVDVELAAANVNDSSPDNWLEEVSKAVANISDEDEELLARELRRIRTEARELAAKGKF